MPAAPNLLVIDFNAESRQLLVRTLRRKFPGAVIHEVEDADEAAAMARTSDLAAIVTHRTFEVEGIPLVRQLRAAAPRALIVMVSGIDRSAEALAAGATAFLSYDEWLRIGSVVEEQMKERGER